MLTNSIQDLMATAKPYHIYPGKKSHVTDILRARLQSAFHGSVMLTRIKGFATVAYPNRDSTPYKERYNIPEAQTIIRYVIQARNVVGYMSD